MRPGLRGNDFANSNSPRVRIKSARGAWVSRDTCQQFPSRFMPLMFLRLAPQSTKGKPYPQVRQAPTIIQVALHLVRQRPDTNSLQAD